MISAAEKAAMLAELSPLDYFFEFQNHVQAYSLDRLRKIGRSSAFSRLPMVKELDFSNIIGQRLAKQMIREEVVRHIWNRRSEEGEICSKCQPLSMIFAGPSGIGKTELAECLAKLMNQPGEDAFLKVDCGKLTHANEVFGMSGAYQGAYEGSALNNFILRMSQTPDSLGIVLLDEIEKAERDVIHGLYQVIDKGEWTNKKLEEGKGKQTETVRCDNVIFIMTTNAADALICDHVARSDEYYTAESHDDQEEIMSLLESSVRKKLQNTYPFTAAFMGRIGRVVPFLPMANGDTERHPLKGEMMTVAKLLIEREQEKLASSSTSLDVHQLVSAKTKHRMARIIVNDAIVEAGVRSIQKGVEVKMGNRMMHSLLLETGGIKKGAKVSYSATEEDNKIDFRVTRSGAVLDSNADEFDALVVVDGEY